MAKSKVDKWLEKENLILLEGWAREGLIDEQIAHNMGIVRSTLTEWKKKYSVIDIALKKGKEVVDFEVENALLKRALGYQYKEVIKEKMFNPVTEKYEMVVTKETTKEVAPDVTAQIYWLKNRKPKEWRDRVEVRTDDEQLNKVDELLSKIKEEANNDNI